MERMIAVEIDAEGRIVGTYKGARMLPEALKRRGYIEISPEYIDVFSFFTKNFELILDTYRFEDGKIHKMDSEQIKTAIREKHEKIDAQAEDLKRLEALRAERLKKDSFLNMKRGETHENIALGIKEMKEKLFSVIDREADHERSKVPDELSFPEVPGDFILKDYREDEI